MGKHEGHDPPDDVAGLPDVVVVELTVLRDPDARPFPVRIPGNRGDARRRVIAGLALVLAVATVGTLWLGNRNAGPSLVNVVARERGPMGVAAAYAYPPSCLSVTILTIARAHARADFNHQTRCGHDTGDPVAIFRYVSGAWRPVLDTIAYLCPVASLPARVQTQLDACLPTRADRRALDR